MEDFSTVLTRRRLLQVSGVLLVGLTSCRTGDFPPPRPGIDPEAALRQRVRADEQQLIAAYDATLARYSRLRKVLAGPRADHAAHLAAVSDALPAEPSGTRTRPARVAGNAAAAVSALVAAERAAGRARAADCRTAASAVAGLLASIGASEAAHAMVLPGGLRPGARMGAPTPLWRLPSDTALDAESSAAANAALTGEHAAIYAFGVVGARLGRREQPWAVAAISAHRARRDALTAGITRSGVSPVPAEAAYALPFAVPNRAAALRLAALVNDRLAALYVALIVAAGEAGLRWTAASAVQASAAEAATWRLGSRTLPVTRAFPGR